MHRLVLVVALVACQKKEKAENKPPPPEPVTPVQPEVKGPTLDPGAFDRACKAATDCIVVKKASCDPCACPDDAIASSAMAKFDEEAAKLDCGKPDIMRNMECAPCGKKVAACEAGQCVAK